MTNPATEKPRKARKQVSAPKGAPLKRGKGSRGASLFPGLTVQEAEFVRFFLKHNNAARASREAGYSPNSPCNGSRLLSRDDIANAIREQRERLFEETEIEAHRILLEQARIAFFDPRRLFDFQGNPLPVHELDNDTAGAIAAIEVRVEPRRGASEDEDETPAKIIKYTIAPKGKALDSLMKWAGLFERDNRQKSESALEVLKELMTGIQQRGSRLVQGPAPLVIENE